MAVVGHRAGFLFPLYLHRGTNKKPALPLCGSPLPYYVQCWAAILLAEGMLSLHNGREINNAPPMGSLGTRRLAIPMWPLLATMHREQKRMGRVP